MWSVNKSGNSIEYKLSGVFHCDINPLNNDIPDSCLGEDTSHEIKNRVPNAICASEPTELNDCQKCISEQQELLGKRSPQQYFQDPSELKQYKGRWTIEEDRFLKEELNGKKMSRRWDEITKSLPGRTIKQCKDRLYYLNGKERNYTKWTDADRFLVFLFVKVYGCEWKIISEKMKSKTMNQLSMQWRFISRRSDEFEKKLSFMLDNNNVIKCRIERYKFVVKTILQIEDMIKNHNTMKPIDMTQFNLKQTTSKEEFL